MASKTGRRILECVPRFLSAEDQFQILAFYMPQFISRYLLKSELFPNHIDVTEVHQRFCKLCETVIADSPSFDWFVGTAFSVEEIQEFIRVFKFGVLERLRESYLAVKKDLNAIVPLLRDFSAVATAKYEITDIQAQMKLSSSALLGEPDFPTIPEPAIASRFRPQFRRMMVEQSLQAELGKTHRQGLQQILLGDLVSLRRAIESLNESNDVAGEIVGVGYGGTVTIVVKRRNQTALRLQVFKYTSLAASLTLALFVLCSWVLTTKIPGSVFLLLLFVLPVIIRTWKMRAEALQELKSYEQQRATWSTKN